MTNKQFKNQYIDMNDYAFLKGYGQVQRRHIVLVKNEIMEALGLKARNNWYFRLYGKIEPKISEAKAIEDIFKKYGITDIWGR